MARSARVDRVTTVLVVVFWAASLRLLPAVCGEHHAPFFNPDCAEDCSWRYFNPSINATPDGVPQQQFCKLSTSDPDGLTEVCHNPFRPPTDPHERPSKPQNFRLVDFNKNISSFDGSSVEQYTCVHIIFNLEPTAARNAKGLQLLLLPKGIEDIPKKYCVNLNFSETGLNFYAIADKFGNPADLMFSCFCGLKPGSPYTVGVRTLPVDIMGTSEYNTMQKIDHIPPGCSHPTKVRDVRCQKSPEALWVAQCITTKQDISTLYHKGDYDIVEFSFETAPESFCFDVYDVFVYPSVGPHSLLDYVKVTMNSVTTVNRMCTQLGKTLPFVIVRFNTTTWPPDKVFHIALHPHSNVCKSCRDSEGGETQCSNTFTRDFYVIEDPCKRNPCGHYGECVPVEKRYNCTCTVGYMVWAGTCIADPCQSGHDVGRPNPCQNGECSYSAERDDYVCYCDENYLNVGKTCLADPCSEDPATGTTICGEHGHCNRTVAPEMIGHVCICDPGYSVQDKIVCQEATKLAWFVIILSIIAGLVLFILLVWLRKKTALWPCKKEERIETSSRQPPSAVAYRVIPERSPRPVDVGISTRFVLPIYSEDHPRHKDVVMKFCRFLHRHLTCEVSLIDWQPSIGPTVEMWLTKEIEKADIVLLLCSKGTRLKYNARARNAPVPTNTECEYGDVFVKALTLLDDYFSRNNADEKFVVGYFDYSSAEDIPVSFRRFKKFRLMPYIEDLCLRIHGRVRDSPRSSRRVPDLQRYQDLEMGRPLYDAIEAMKETIRVDKFWYENNKAELIKAPSVFFDEDSSGQGSDGDNYDELMSQLKSTLPCVQAADDFFALPEMHTPHPATSSSLPMYDFFSDSPEPVEDSGYMSPNV